jgi:hypothetical protein
VTDVEVRRPVALRTLPGIEMAAVGTWHASTGVTTFTQEDFIDAVAALECPGVRNPVIKLGHSEEDSTSGVRWDGEPALGWVANMRFDGAKLIGDFTGLPAWLADADENGLSVMAAAYPDRSIEIYRPFLCQVGHVHPSAVTAISLLGVAPPAIGVLKSMQDVYALWTEPAVGEAVQAAAVQRGEDGQRSLAAGAERIEVMVHMAAEPERRPLTDIEKRAGTDFEALDDQWTEALDALMDVWPDLAERQRDQLAKQVASAVDDAPDTLGELDADSSEIAEVLIAAMLVVARQAADAQIAEADGQGVTIAAPDIDEDLVRDTALAVAAAMAASTASTAGRTAAQYLGQGDGAAISAQVSAHLAGLSDAFPRSEFGGALSAAQARGRFAVLEGFAGAADYYASEVLDRSTCQPCKSIDTKRFDSLDAALAAYGSGKYQGCAGGARCRGHLITIFGSDRASVATTVRMTLGGPMGTTGGVVKASVSVEDISRRYYESAGYSMWISELQVDPLQLVVADDSTGKHFRVPVELSGDQFTFGEPQEVAVQYVDVKTAAMAPVQFAERKLALLAAGKNEDGTDRVAKDVSPAGAAIRKAADKTAAAVPAVLETEVAAPEAEPQTPDADPAAGPITTPKEASVDAAKMREALGLGPDADDDEVREAFAAQLSASTPAANEPDPLAALTAQLPAGERPILVDPENYRSLVAMAAKGETAYQRVVKTEGREFLEKAAQEGRFPVARLSVYQEMWDKNPEETRAYVNLMPKNTVPTLATGLLGAEISQNESDLAYEGMYGKAVS